MPQGLYFVTYKLFCTGCHKRLTITFIKANQIKFDFLQPSQNPERIFKYQCSYTALQMAWVESYSLLSIF